MRGHLADSSPPRVEAPISLEAVRKDPLGFLAEQSARLGDIFAYELGGFSAVFLGRPAHIKHVLRTNARNYVKTGTPDMMMLKPMLGDGLMTSEGESWREQRRMAQPAFHAARMNALVGTVATLAAEMCDRWTPIAEAGGTIDLENEMSRLTLTVIARVLFGFELDDSVADFGSAVATMNEFMAHFDPADARGLAAFRDARANVSRITQDILDRRRGREPAGDDLLGMLLAAGRGAQPSSDREIRDQVFTFLMAGHETTAKSLTWTLYLLDRHPEFRRPLRDEARSVLSSEPNASDVERLGLTWMVLQEAMRLYPPVWLMSRLAAADDWVDGYHIPAGTLVVVSPYVLHREARYWAEPEVFDPHRFAADRASQMTDGIYYPFGVGPRICIGRGLAKIETIVVLASIARRFDLHLVPGHRVEPEALVTLRPRYGMPMTVKSA